jgi:hypothetical protein
MTAGCSTSGTGFRSLARDDTALLCRASDHGARRARPKLADLGDEIARLFFLLVVAFG